MKNLLQQILLGINILSASKMTVMKNLKQCYLGAIIFAMSAVVQAQAWPSKPLNLIVPFPPGGATDILGRVLSESLPSKLGQPAVVENTPGGSTVIGVMAALRAPADGLW